MQLVGADRAVAGRILEVVAALGGSISAEHGIGRLKVEQLHLARSADQIDWMRRIKATVDPDGLLNPGVLLDAAHDADASRAACVRATAPARCASLGPGRAGRCEGEPSERCPGKRHAPAARHTLRRSWPHSARAAGRACMLGPVSGRPLVIAHRGASALRAEHTLAAYELAIEQGADGLECDVRLTADGHLVCVHDRRIDRTSDGWGVVSTKTLADLRRHDFGSWAQQEGPRPARRPLRERRVADRRLESWPGEDVLSDPSGGILTLPTLLDLVTSSPRPILLAIETKHPTRYAGWVEQAVVAQLRRFGLANPARQGPHPVRVMSFSAQAVRRFRALAPGVPRVFLMDRVPLRLRAGDLPFGATIAGPDIAILRAHPSYAARVRRLGGQLYVWTVDEPDDVELCRELGVAAVITNRPGDVSAAVRRTT